LNQGVTTGTTLAATTTAITASAATITAGASVTLTTTITGASGSTGVPTGTVTFFDGTTTLGTGTLNGSAVATYATSSLATGTHSITAQYGGDSNFAASTSTAVTVTVQAPVPASFTLSASPTTLSITPGAAGTTTVSVTPAGGFAQPVSFACSGLPSEATCTFAPATVTPGASAVSTTLTITTTAAQPAVQSRIYRSGVAGLLALGSLLLFAAPETKRAARWGRWVVLVMALTLGGGLISCGGGGSSGGGGTTPANPGTPAGTTTVTVTATSGSLNQTASLKMTVQ
jgi:Bacterial Ig-like domain (group 3)